MSDPYKDLFGLDLPPERLQEVLAAYAEIGRASCRERVYSSV